MSMPNLRVLAVIALAAAASAGLGARASAADTVPAKEPAAPAARPCAPADLTLREVSATAGALPEAVYALRNRGAAACLIAGSVGIRLFDAQGKPIPLRTGPNSALPAQLALAVGDEAWFTVTYGRTGTSQCVTSARIEVSLPAQTTPLSAPTGFTGCAFPSIRISNVRQGVPSPAPSAAPSPAMRLVT